MSFSPISRRMNVRFFSFKVTRSFVHDGLNDGLVGLLCISERGLVASE